MRSPLHDAWAGSVQDISIAELMLAYVKHADQYYTKDGVPSGEARNIKGALRVVKRLYARQPVSAFGPIALKAVRQAMIDAGHCRTHINTNIGRVKRMFKWGVESELAPPSVYHGLQAVSGLRRGRSNARESAPVKPVPQAFVDAVVAHVSPQVAAMIRLQELTGMRPGEVTIVRTCDLDTSGRIWTYTPVSHKTEHHGHERVIYLGPQAQEVLKPWLRTSLQEYVFSPAEAEAAHNAKRRMQRKTPLWPSHLKHQAKKRKRNQKLKLRDHYTVTAYNRAIDHGLAQANKLIEDDKKKIPHWHPHQLRHNAATRIRKESGLEAARVVLGHRSAAVTELYAEIDRLKAADIMLKVG